MKFFFYTFVLLLLDHGGSVLTERRLQNCPSSDINGIETRKQQKCIFADQIVTYEWNCTCFSNTTYINITTSTKEVDDNLKIFFGAIGNKRVVAEINMTHYLKCIQGVFSTSVTGHYLGEMVFDVRTANNEGSNFVVKVCREQTLLEDIVVLIVMPLILFNKLAFGAKIEIDSLKEYVLRPKELFLCFFVQFCLLPLCAIFLGYMFKLNILTIVSLLVAAVCPGGGGGYVFSFLIDGDITLAIAISLFSTLFAMLAMPLVIGVFTLFVKIPHDIIIPYTKIILILVTIAIPISAGMLLRYFRPNWAKTLIKVIKPLSIMLIFIGSVMMIFMAKYVVVYGPWEGYALAFIIPLCGFILAVILCKLSGLDWTKTKAVALESGMKNTLLGVAVIEISFAQPTADLASVIILMITAGQTLLCVFTYLVYLLKSKFVNRTKESDHKKVSFGRDISEDTVAFLDNY